MSKQINILTLRGELPERFAGAMLELGPLLGFAAGVMTAVVCFDLLADAVRSSLDMAAVYGAMDRFARNGTGG